MEIVPILVTVILISTIVTILLGLGSYVAFRLRERRRPFRRGGLPKPQFFRRFDPAPGPPEREAPDPAVLPTAAEALKEAPAPQGDREAA